MSAIPEKRLCKNCDQERTVCRHVLCELCDDEHGFECFAIVPAIKLPESGLLKRINEEREQGGQR
jgi:hypothetical protein